MTQPWTRVWGGGSWWHWPAPCRLQPGAEHRLPLGGRGCRWPGGAAAPGHMGQVPARPSHPFPMCTAPAESPGWPKEMGWGRQGPTGGRASPPALSLPPRGQAARESRGAGAGHGKGIAPSPAAPLPAPGTGRALLPAHPSSPPCCHHAMDVEPEGSPSLPPSPAEPPAWLRVTLAQFGWSRCRKPAQLGKASLPLPINSLMTLAHGFAKSGQPWTPQPHETPRPPRPQQMPHPGGLPRDGGCWVSQRLGGMQGHSPPASPRPPARAENWLIWHSPAFFPAQSVSLEHSLAVFP